MNQISFKFDMSPAEATAYEACKWVKDNRRDFKLLMCVFHNNVNQGVSCTKRGELEHWARFHGITPSNDEAFQFDHNLYAALTRYMVMLMPRLARTINFRKSALDDVDLASIWYEVVDSRTAFLADNRYMAQHLVDIDDACAR